MNRPLWVALFAVLGLSTAIGRAGDAPATQPAATAPSDTLPAKLRPYAHLAQQCRDYGLALAAANWKSYYSYDFSDGPDKWLTQQKMQERMGNLMIFNGQGAQNPNINMFTRLEYKVVGKTRVGVLTASPQNPYAYLPIGPTIKGWYAVEFVGRNTSDHPCDLSIWCVTVNLPNRGELSGPVFQFGGYNNTRNLISPVNKQGPAIPGMEPSVELPHDVLIEKDRWFKVRMEVADGRISAFVDDRLIGQTAVGDGYDPTIEQIVRLYTWGGSAEFKSVKFEKYAPGARPTEAQAWAKVFGDTSRDEVRGRIDELVKLLADGDGAVRGSAQILLRNMGDLAIPSLEAVDDSAPPELVQSAALILQMLQIPAPAAATQPDSATQPAVPIGGKP